MNEKEMYEKSNESKSQAINTAATACVESSTSLLERIFQIKLVTPSTSSTGSQSPAALAETPTKLHGSTPITVHVSCGDNDGEQHDADDEADIVQEILVQTLLKLKKSDSELALRTRMRLCEPKSSANFRFASLNSPESLSIKYLLDCYARCCSTRLANSRANDAAPLVERLVAQCMLQIVRNTHMVLAGVYSTTNT